jgi:NADPH:quinone reductase
MRAAVLSEFGPPSSVRVVEVPMPPCKSEDVLIKVAAAGVNPVDWKECEGFLGPFYPQYPELWSPGYDAAGTVHSVGSAVTQFRVGQRVVAFSDRRDNGHNGTFAEFVRVLASAVAPVPDKVSLITAAALPTAGLTGYQALFHSGKGNLRSGDSVLIHGAAGGVGSYAVQFAKACGLRVAATCAARNEEYVADLGAELVIAYDRQSIDVELKQWRADGLDAIIDCVSGSSLPNALEVLRPGGRLVSIATLTQDGDIAADTEKALQRGRTKVFSIIDFSRIDADLREMLAMINDGKVTPPPLTTFPLRDAPQALQRMKDGQLRGKIVLMMDA